MHEVYTLVFMWACQNYAKGVDLLFSSDWESNRLTDSIFGCFAGLWGVSGDSMYTKCFDLDIS